VVQGFIFLGGLKLGMKCKAADFRFSVGTYYLSRLTRVILPYLLFVVIYYLYFVQHHYFDFSVTDLAGYVFSGNLASHFYFVVIIAQFYLLCPLWVVMMKKCTPAIPLFVSLILMILLGQYFPDIITAFFPKAVIPDISGRLFFKYLFYWTAGCFAGLHYEKFTEYLARSRKSLILLFCAAAIPNLYATYLIQTRGMALPWIETLHILYSASAILLTLSLALKWEEKAGCIDKILAPLDKASYNIYLIHPLILTIANEWMYSWGITGLTERLLIRAAITIAGSLILCIGWELGKAKIQSIRKKQ